ncbi:MAG: type II toxin-antitoxin system RelE/ParE family toxin [Chloroflexi bacterium]|nr:type II toxin-antitoxin system RelE/ParE family toxin [Chloroflexota bacterium]
MERLSQAVRHRVFAALDRLCAEHAGNTQKLHGMGDEYRLRVGDWRVLFRSDVPARTIVVLQVRPRGWAYRR